LCDRFERACHQSAKHLSLEHVDTERRQPTSAVCRFCRAKGFVLLPVTQPPQVKPITANPAAPATAQGGLDGWMGFGRISSFDAITGLQFRRLPWHEQVRKVLICLSLARTQNPKRRRSLCSGGSNRCADQGREGPRAGLLHDCRAMVVDRALADAEIGGDVLAWVSSEH
jgi:hypothetical protein